MKDQEPIRIYVRSLASYNAGTQHGCWIDATLPADEIFEDVYEMLSTCPHKGEDWAIHDSEGFGGIELGESESLWTISALAQLLLVHDRQLIAALWRDADNLEEIRYRLEEGYAGCFSSEGEYAREFAEECGLIEGTHALFPYIDWESFARDMVLGGTIRALTTESGDCHIFWS